jgi:8-oxo-dGTP pyrophosphatase MutT (NUDIX family)
LHIDSPKSVAGIVFSTDRKEVLLIKRRDVPVWTLPGGGIDEDETSSMAVEREILEETGFTVKVVRLIGDYIPMNRLAKRTHLFECKILSGEKQITDETRGIGFFPLNALPLMPPPYLEWIEDAQKNLPPFKKKLSSINYKILLKNLILHPTLVFRFLLARAGLTINSK